MQIVTRFIVTPAKYGNKVSFATVDGSVSATWSQGMQLIMTGVTRNKAFSWCWKNFVSQSVVHLFTFRAVSKKTSLAEKGTGGTNLMQFLKSVREASDHAHLTQS